MLRNRDLNLLPIFNSLMEERHLSRASEKLCMSQPAVSNALKRLRVSFKDDLFTRTRAGLVPTERAIELHASISPAISLMEKSFEIGVFDPSTANRELNISINTATETLFLANLLQKLRPQAPSLTYRFHPDILQDLPARLRDGRLSYAIEYVPLPPSHYDSITLFKETPIMLCSKNHPQIKGDSITLKQIQSLPHVSATPRSSLTPETKYQKLTPLEQIIEGKLPSRKIAVYASSLLSLPSIIATTDLIGVVGQTMAQPYIEKGQLKELSLPFELPNYDIALYWHKSRTNDPCHIWLLEQLIGYQLEIL